MRFGPMEIGLIILIVLIVFGVGKLPQVGGALGKGIKEFRHAVKGEDEGEKDLGAGVDSDKSSKT